MKVRFIFVMLLGLVTAFSFIGCEGDVGPQGIAGPAGPTGPQGPSGNNGQNGENGAESCLECHGNNQLITAKVFQWENSIHATGGHYVRNTGQCGSCHTSQGFLARLASGEGVDWEGDVADPLPQNCYTCHNIHTTYTDADWALTAENADIWITGQTENIGSSSLCLNCHQPRIPGDGVPAVGETGDYTITSSRYGPHHGAQGSLYLGVGKSGMYEVGDGYTNGFHATGIDNACINCHMADVEDGRGSGGHTFRVTSADGELNTNGCIQCHTADESEMLVMNTQAEVQALLDELAVKLRAIGILNPTADRSVPGTYPAVVVGCYYNYISIVEDQSFGVHNGKYIKKILENSIAAL
jgi:hypothetical protein